MLIFIQDQKVRTRLIEHSLSQTWIDTYKPFGWVSELHNIPNALPPLFLLDIN